MRHPDTELQMGAVGPRQLVSARGLEFTVGIKYETNIIIPFAGLFNQLFPFAQEGKEGLIVQDGASQWLNCSFKTSIGCIFLWFYKKRGIF